MRIAKRTLGVSKAQLNELFNIPDTVEITGVRTAKDGSIEFQLVSAGEVFVGEKQITVFQEEGYMNRRINVKTLLELEGDLRRNFIEKEEPAYLSATAVDFAGTVGLPITSSPTNKVHKVPNEQSEASAQKE